jgi:hypothetical protein
MAVGGKRGYAKEDVQGGEAGRGLFDSLLAEAFEP